MGLEGALSAINMTAGVVGQVAGGFGASRASSASGRAAQEAYNAEADLLEEQSAINSRETLREGQRRAEEIRRFREMQASKYNASGVLLEGTPLVVLADTAAKGAEEVAAILARGEAQASLARKQANQLRNRGRNALIAARSQGRSALASSLFNIGRLGVFARSNADFSRAEGGRPALASQRRGYRLAMPELQDIDNGLAPIPGRLPIFENGPAPIPRIYG